MSKSFEDIGKLYYSFGFQPELIGSKPRVVVGKWSDRGVIEKKLRDYGLTASADQIGKILLDCQRAGLGYHRPLNDDEVIKIAIAGGAIASDE
jgi:hypothetical protein